MGRREENLRRAVLLIGERVGEVLRQSSVLETEPWGYESDNKFLNAVILCQTELSPRQLLQAVKQIERDMGRVTKPKVHSRYADRPIDIDILLYDNLTVDDPDLKIPHPLMHERDFVMIPLNEIYE